MQNRDPEGGFGLGDRQTHGNKSEESTQQKAQLEMERARVYEWRRDLFVKHDRWASLQAICRGPPEGNGIPTYRQGQQRPSQDRSLGGKRIKSLWGKGWTRRGLALWPEDVAHGKRALGCFHLDSLASVLSRPLWTPISSSINWVSVVLAVGIMRNHIQQLELLSARGGGSCQYWGVPSVPQGCPVTPGITVKGFILRTTTVRL